MTRRVRGFAPVVLMIGTLFPAAASVAHADGTPTLTVTKAVQKHFAPRRTTVSQISCTRPNSTTALCSARAQVAAPNAAQRGIFRVTLNVHIPLDVGLPTSKITRVTRIG